MDQAPDYGEEAEEAEEGPLRRCIASGQRYPKESLLRFVVGPDGMLVPDLDGKLPGRGLWLSSRRDMIHTAVAKRLFAKAARRAVGVPDDLADRVEALLVKRCLNMVALARRAGQAICGFEKVKAELQAGRAQMLLLARDAAPGGKDKTRHLAQGLCVVELFDQAELGMPFGRDYSVHVVLTPGGLARRLKADTALLAGFRAGDV